MSPIKKSKSAHLMKEMRKDIKKTQQQVSMDMFQSREYISKQEGGERKIPPVTTKYFIEKYNNPWLALEIANEYIGWGITRLDGPAAYKDKHCEQLRLEKELNKTLNIISKLELTTDITKIHSMEKQDIHRSTREIARVIHFSTLYLATLCETHDISWLKVWNNHHSDLKSKGYVT